MTIGHEGCSLHHTVSTSPVISWIERIEHFVDRSIKILDSMT